MTLATEALLLTLLRRVTALEALVGGEGGGGGTPGTFFGFGPSTKSNNMGEAGYDRTGDSLTAGGYITIQTQGDTPNLAIKRQEWDENNSTGWADNTTVARYGAIPVNKNGINIYNNGSDGECAGIAMRLHIDNNGDTPTTAYSIITLNVIDSREVSLTKAPGSGVFLELNGQNGGRLIFHGRNANGSAYQVTLAQPST